MGQIYVLILTMHRKRTRRGSGNIKAQRHWEKITTVRTPQFTNRNSREYYSTL